MLSFAAPPRSNNATGGGSRSMTLWSWFGPDCWSGSASGRRETCLLEATVPKYRRYDRAIVSHPGFCSLRWPVPTPPVHTRRIIMSALARAGREVTNDQPIVHVIDDDVSLRDALGLLLPSVGVEARTYASVQEFLDARGYDGPGCIILDVRLPGISGLDF